MLILYIVSKPSDYSGKQWTTMTSSTHSRHASLMVAAALVVLFIGSSDAWCPPGYKNCDYNYRNGCKTCIKSDVNNCGDCKVKCPTYPYTTPTCSWGKCGYTCVNGWKDCDGNKYNGCEANLKIDTNNCGNCGVKCQKYPYATTKCNNSKCEYTCTAGWKDCNYNWKDGCETNVGKDIYNCGGCGVKCRKYPYATTKCNNGKCEYTCNPGWKDCNYNWNDGCETNVGNSINNCGGCGVKCQKYPYSTTKCNNGKCEYTCTPGWQNCDNNWKDGCKTDVGKDINNCGGCGKKCPRPTYWGGEATCSNGKCGMQCKTGFKYDNYSHSCVHA